MDGSQHDHRERAASPGSVPPVRIGERRGRLLRHYLRDIVLGVDSTYAANLFRDLTRLRHDACGLADDLVRAVNRPTIIDHDLDELRSRTGRISRRADRTSRLVGDGRALDRVASAGDAVADAVAALRQPDPGTVRVRDGHFASTRSTVREYVDAFRTWVHHIEIDVSGVDLSGLNPADVDVDEVANVVWTVHTEWPADIAGEIRQRSAVVAPGVFRLT